MKRTIVLGSICLFIMVSWSAPFLRTEQLSIVQASETPTRVTATPNHPYSPTVSPTRIPSQQIRQSQTPTPTFSYPPNATPILGTSTPDASQGISPDNRWRIDYEVNPPYRITVTSLIDHKIYKDLNPDISALGRYEVFASWFPDYSGFITIGADRGCERCPYDRLILYQMDTKANALRRYIYEPLKERNEAFWYDIVWSPDGSNFAVIVGSREIHFVNRKAQVLNRYKPFLKDKSSSVSTLFWNSYGFFYKIRNQQPYPENEIDEIYLVDPAHLNLPANNLLTRDDLLRIIAFDPYSPRFLIELFSFSTGKTELAIFNIQTRRFEKTVYTTYRDITGIAITNDSSIICFEENSKENNLFMFYWKTEQVVDQHVTVGDLRDWDPDLNAFIIFDSDFSGHYWTEAIRP